MKKTLRTRSFELSLIKSIELEASKIPGVISLAQGIPSFPIAEGIREHLKKILDNKNVGKYSLTNGLPLLREAVSLNLEKLRIHADADKEILITAGASEAISATLLTLLEPGDEIILFGPCYASYISAVKTAHGVIRWVELDKENWRLDLDEFKNAITPKTRAVFFANPNNPTGTFFPKDELLKIAELAVKNGLYIIVDEVYRDFVYGTDVYFSLLRESKFRENVISIYSFSKAYALTGFRIGYLVADEKLVREIVKVHDALANCAPVISQYAAYYALEFEPDLPSAYKNEFISRRAIVLSWLDKHKDHFSYSIPEAAYFVFPKLLQNSDSRKFVKKILKESKVALVPGIAFGPAGEGHLRISFGAEEDKIRSALNRVGEILR